MKLPSPTPVATQILSAPAAKDLAFGGKFSENASAMERSPWLEMGKEYISSA
jgi:hypothetical protein